MYFNEEHKKEVESRKGYKYIGSYRNGEISIDGDKKRRSGCVRIKCLYCKYEYDVRKSDFIEFNRQCIHCCNEYEKSLAYYIEVENKMILKDILSIDECDKHPNFMYPKSSKYNIGVYWNDKFKKHTYLMKANSFSRYDHIPNRRSFADWCMENIGENWQDKYWSDKNTEDPWEIDWRSNKKYWFKCIETDYHEDYLCKINNFTRGNRCPYCKNKKVHIKDSFGTIYPQYVDYWSYKNNKTPFEVSPKSNSMIIFICETCKKDFIRTPKIIVNSNTGCHCSSCSSSEGEQIIKLWLDKNNIEYIPQKSFDGLVGLKNGLLSYDFYLPNHNLLIEFQGEQHKEFTPVFHIDEQGFEKQKEHDNLKRYYARKHNIKLLEIWYYDKDNIELILGREVK